MSPIRTLHRPWLILAALPLFASAPAFAIDSICVGDSAALGSAMLAAESAPKRIMLSQAGYNLFNSGHSWQPRPGTSIEGGYFSGCSSRQIDRGNTIVNADFQLDITMFGNLTIEGLTFQLQHGLTINTGTGFIPGSQVTFRRDVFQLSGPSFHGGILNISWFLESVEGTANALVVDSLFFGDTATDETCVIELETEEGSSRFTLVNNTVFGNTGGGVCMRNYPDSDAPGNGSLFAYNNIFYGNNGGDLYADTANLELKWNTFGTLLGPTPTTEQFTQHADPKLDANFRPIESPASPVINTGAFDGNPDLPARDLDGGPRVVGTRVDRGVYESSINDAFLLTVRNTNDSGADSLRAAIASANANGGGLIWFEIPGDCTPAHVITLATALPAIASPVIIDGFSQAGAGANTLDVGNDADICVVLEGGNTIGNGLLVNPNPPANTQLTVIGLGFSGFVDAAINLSGGSGHGVQGNHIGGKANGITLAPSAYGVYVAEGVSNVAIGGDYASNRNLIGDATQDGIHIHGPANAKPAASANTVRNNYVGVGWANSAFVDHGNGKKGIHVLGSDNDVSGNTVGFNTSDGVDLDGTSATGNFVEANRIGAAPDADGVLRLMGNSVGVRVENAAHDNKIRSNAIEYNAGPGVRIVSGLGNTVRYNSLFFNGYPNDTAIGIDIAGLGVTPNDDDGTFIASQTANRGLNFPLLTLATGAPQATAIVQGLLTSTPGDYLIDLYSGNSCDGSGNGEGVNWIASGKVRIDPGHTFATFTIEAGTFFQPQAWTITATATDAATNPSPGNTSEFSACKPMTNDRIFASGFDPPPI
jgi:parallel beta-helix repeat protein